MTSTRRKFFHTVLTAAVLFAAFASWKLQIVQVSCQEMIETAKNALIEKDTVLAQKCLVDIRNLIERSEIDSLDEAKTLDGLKVLSDICCSPFLDSVYFAIGKQSLRFLATNPERVVAVQEYVASSFWGMENWKASVEAHESLLYVLDRIGGMRTRPRRQALTALGVSYLNLGNVVKAESLFDCAYNEMQYDTTSACADSAVLMTNLGIVNQERHSYDAAAHFFLSALSLRRRVQPLDSLSIAAGLNYLGLLNSDIGHFEQADSILREALTIRRNSLGERDFDVALTMYDLAINASRAGEIIRAKQYLRYCGRLRVEPDDKIGSFFLDCIQQLAHLEMASGNIEISSMLLDSVCRLVSQPDWRQDRSDEVAIFSASASQDISIGELQAAERKLLHCLKLVGKDTATFKRLYYQTLNDLAIVCAKRDQLSKAETYLRDCLRYKMADSASTPLDRAVSLLNIADILIQQGNLDSAQACCRLIVSLLRKEPGALSIRAKALNGLAICEKLSGDYEAAEQTYREALKLWNDELQDHSLSIGELLINLSLLKADKHDYWQAESLATRATYLLSGLKSSSSSLATAFEILARTCRKDGKPNSAIEYALKALAIRDTLFSINSPVLSEPDLIEFASQLRESKDLLVSLLLLGYDPKQPATNRAIEDLLNLKYAAWESLVMRRRRISLMNDSATSTLMDSLKLAEAVLSSYYRPAEDMAWKPSFDNVVSASRLVDSLQGELSRRYANYVWDYRSNHRDLDSLRAVLPHSSILLDFHRFRDLDEHKGLGEGRYACIAVSGESIVQLVDLGPSEPIDSLIALYRLHIDSLARNRAFPKKQDKARFEEISKRLFSLLLEVPLRSVDGITTILIRPDGQLSHVSFGSLIDSTGSFLVERFATQIISALYPAPVNSTALCQSSGLLAFGNPDFNASCLTRRLAGDAIVRNRYGNGGQLDAKILRPTSHWRKRLIPRLPGTAVEVSRIANAWRSRSPESVTVLSGASASEEAFKTSSHGYRVVHLATHGFFDQDFWRGVADSLTDLKQATYEFGPLLRSGLLLAGSGLDDAAHMCGNAEDGYLSAIEVASTNLCGTELVILAACESGVDVDLEGSIALGLSFAFHAAGARNVLAALWPLDDEQSAFALDKLYEHLDKDLSSAVRLMQLATIERLRNDGLSDHPLSWGAYVLSGDLPRCLSGQR